MLNLNAMNSGFARYLKDGHKADDCANYFRVINYLADLKTAEHNLYMYIYEKRSV